MANNLKDFGEIVKKCKILLLDIEGTTTSISFVKEKLFPYAEENVKQFLDSQWDSEDVKEAVSALRKLAVEDKEKNVDGIIDIPEEDATKEEQIEGLVKNVKWQMSSDRKTGALKQLQGLIWKQGYDKGDIKGHVYDDVPPALEQWKAADGQKVYIYSSGSVQAQNLLFGQSLAGDLLKYIEGHFDTAVGSKQEADSYKSIVEKIGCSADDVLFLTDIVKEAESARTAGLNVALVTRDGNAALPDEASTDYPVIDSLSHLAVSNKRKTAPEDEQPAKVPKIDVNDDVKSSSDAKSDEAQEKEEQSEKMEVDAADTTEPPIQINNEENPVATKEAAEEEVTDSNNSSVPEKKPVIAEKDVEKPVAEKMETETIEKNGTKEEEILQDNIKTNEPTEINEESQITAVQKEQSDEKKDNVPVTEATVTTTGVEETTSDKESLAEVAEIIEDLEPVVEEPPENSDMDELQNVGEVLEKECDEILSKVQNVINLENISVKPILNPIIEEAMEAENEVPSDVVDKILESEAELKSNLSNSDVKSDSVEKENTKAAVDIAENNVANDEICKSKETIEVNGDPQKTETSLPEINDKIESVADKVQKDDSKEQPAETPKTEKNAQVIESVKESIVEDKIVKETDIPTETKETSSETTKETETVETVSEAAPAPAPEEVHLNGDTTNGEKKSLKENGVGDSKEDVNSRLSVENGKEENGENGANGNGDSSDGAKDKGDSKVEAEVTEIKVKSLPAEEPRTDPVEQPTEA